MPDHFLKSMLVFVALTLAVACGRDVSKKFPDNPGNSNTTNNGTNNGTVGTNNGTVGPNNTTGPTNNGTITPNNVPTNNTTGPNNTPTNNGTTNPNNNTIPPELQPIALISGQERFLESLLVDSNYPFDLVGGDEEPRLADLLDFWTSGDAANYETIVVEWGFHSTNLSDNYPSEAMMVLDAVYQWVEDGGLLLDLSGGFAYNAFPSFYELDLVLVQPGTYTAFALDASLPHTEFVWSKADNGNNMAGIVPSSLDPADGETLLVESEVTACTINDFQCANPMTNYATGMFISKEVGQGIIYHGNWVPPLDAEVLETVFSVLPLP